MTLCGPVLSLSKQTFGIDFEPWYQNGYWQDNYIPHVLLHESRVVANISVNLIHTRWEGKEKHYIQLGTVMTDKDYRNQGLARWLMETILSKCQHQCDTIFLFANDSVLNFYPRFGFIQADEYQYTLRTLPFSSTHLDIRKLDMQDPDDIMLLQSIYKTGNSFSALPMINNPGLLMFYCSQYMKDDIYYCSQSEAVVIADFEGDTMHCYDIYGGQDASLEQIVSVMAREDTERVQFGFSPIDHFHMEISRLKEEDTTLFLLNSKDNIFADNQLTFPALSHA